LNVLAATIAVICTGLFAGPTYAVEDPCSLVPGGGGCEVQVSVPEPGMLALIGLGIAGIGISRIKRK
ncbi:MAG: PEP-CTERM sorting domain-containing protein, partial [Pseudomonadales bacterium]